MAPTMRTRWHGLLPLLLMIATLAGCNSQRSVEDIRLSAEGYQFRADYDSAASEYVLITRRYPGDWRAQHKLGVCLLEIEDLRGARRALMLASEMRPDDPEIADDLAEVMFRQGDQAALHGYLRGVVDRRGSVRDHRRLARYALAMDDLDTARVSLQTAIELDQGATVGPYLDSAALAERVGDLDLAIRRLRQAYGIDPRNVHVNEQLVALGEIPGPTIALPPGR